MAYLRGNGTAVLLLIIIVFVSGAIAQPETPMTTAHVDSATIAAHLELPSKQLKEARRATEKLRKRAEEEKDGLRRLALLEKAALTDPAGVQNWHALARFQAEMGNVYHCETSLNKARLCIGFLKGNERREAIADYSVIRAWWHYRRGEWKKGADWGQHAIKAGAGLEAHLAYELNRSRILRSNEQIIEDYSPFYPSFGDWRRGSYSRWCRVVYHCFNYNDFDELWMVDLLSTKRANHYLQESLRWSDHGMYCEFWEEGDFALRFYQLAGQGIQSRGGGWLQRIERRIPVVKTAMPPMPFWANQGGEYVAGSRLAYLGWLRDEMVAASDPTTQDVLAERLLAWFEPVFARYDRHPWPMLWRAEALLELDQVKEAANEIRTAREQFRLLEIEDPALDRVQGRILVVQKKMGKAAPLLRQAVKFFPEDATCWSDLAIAEAVIGAPAMARELLNKALSLDPELAAAWYNRGLLSIKEGDLQSAQSDLEQAATLVPDNEEVQADLARLVQRIRMHRRDR